EDPISVSTLNVGAAINNSNHVTLKNLHVDNVVPGAVGADSAAGPYMIELGILLERTPIDIRFNTRGLPPRSVFHILLPEFEFAQNNGPLLRGVRQTDNVPTPLLE